MNQLIVATNETESKYLDTLFERGIKNNVKDIRIVNAKEIKEIEPNCVVIILVLDIFIVKRDLF